MNLTDRFVQSAKSGEAGRTDFPDQKVVGLVLRVTHAGSKSWAVRYRRKSDGKRQRVTIGSYPQFSLSDARTGALEILSQAARGEDPAKEKKRPSGGRPRTFGELAERYIETYAAKKLSGKEDERQLRADILPQLEGEPLESIQRADIAAIINAIVARGSPIQANRTFSCVRKVFNWGIEAGLSEVMPIARMKPPSKEKSRERVLSPAEIRIFWRRTISQTAMDWQMRALLRICLVTGQRISEVAGARTDELDFERAEWLISGDRAKNGVPHLVPLSPLAARLFQKAAKRSWHDLLILPSTPTDEAMTKSSPSKAMRRAADIYGFSKPATPHDLRRTCGSGIVSLSFPRAIMDKVLNHISGNRSIGAVYDRYEYASEKRAALTAWAGRLTEIICIPRKRVAAE